MKKVFIGVLLLIIIVPLAIIFFRPSSILSKEAANKRFATENSKYVNWRGADLHYVDEGEGIPLVMIHGYGGSHRNFGKIAAILKNDFRVIRVDLPGFGLSDFPQIDEQNTDLIKLYREYMTFFLDELQLDSVYIMGNSMGGWMAWEAAVDNADKVKKLALICSAGYEMDKISGRAVSLMKKKFVERIFSRGMPIYFSEDGAKKCYYDQNKINAEEVRNSNAFWNREGNIHAAFLLAGSGQIPDTARVSLIQCPTLIVWGKEDGIIPSEHAYKFQKAIAGSKLVMYEKCGHIPMIENTEQTAKDFLLFAKGNAEQKL